MEGFVYLWRKSLESEVFQSPELWQLWTWCLMRANFKDRFVGLKIGKGTTTVKAGKGQFIFGRNAGAVDLNCSPSTLWKRMQKLQDIGNIKIESNNQYSVISICNWELYQSKDEGEVTTKEQPSDNQVTTKEQPSDTDNKANKVKKDKKEPKPKPDEGIYSDLFLRFWNAYPKPVGKGAAWNAWTKQKCAKLNGEIFDAIERQRKMPQWLRDGGQYIPHPSTWINQRRWEDEISDHDKDDAEFWANLGKEKS